MKKRLTEVARKLRHEQTPQEVKLWKLLRRQELQGLKFRRQYPVGKYVADFCCPNKKIIIELDGGGHAEEIQASKDAQRDRFFEEQGFVVLRIWNNAFEENVQGLMQKILEFTK